MFAFLVHQYKKVSDTPDLSHMKHAMPADSRQRGWAKGRPLGPATNNTGGVREGGKREQYPQQPASKSVQAHCSLDSVSILPLLGEDTADIPASCSFKCTYQHPLPPRLARVRYIQLLECFVCFDSSGQERDIDALCQPR